MVRNALTKAHTALKFLGRDPHHLLNYLDAFKRMTYTEAVQQLQGTSLAVRWGSDLKAKHEAFLVEQAGNRPLFITHYPKKIKFFNMRVNDDDDRIVNSADLLLPFSGEAAGSAERENDHKRLVERLKTSQMFKALKQRGKTLSDFKEYLDLVKDHPILHAGCGIGFTRVAQSVLGFPDIRMATNYPLQRDVLY
jgi:asparaginyl-tRNA synthetase